MQLLARYFVLLTLTLGAELPLFTELPAYRFLGNLASSVSSSRKLASGIKVSRKLGFIVANRTTGRCRGGEGILYKGIRTHTNNNPGYGVSV